jgi:hypothetical protein
MQRRVLKFIDFLAFNKGKHAQKVLSLSRGEEDHFFLLLRGRYLWKFALKLMLMMAELSEDFVLKQQNPIVLHVQ